MIPLLSYLNSEKSEWTSYWSVQIKKRSVYWKKIFVRKDLENYDKFDNENKIVPVDFFEESTYVNR